MADIRVIGPRKTETDPDLIKALRGLLEAAEAGTLAAMAGVIVYHDRHVGYLQAGEADWYAMSGRLHQLSVVVADEEEAEDDDE